MAEGGFENPWYEPDDWWKKDDDDDGGGDGNETTPFLPGSAFKPGPSGEQIEIKNNTAWKERAA